MFRPEYHELQAWNQKYLALITKETTSKTGLMEGIKGKTYQPCLKRFAPGWILLILFTTPSLLCRSSLHIVEFGNFYL